ncbi:GNAT family N-acetyltransferase [Luteimicrobium sp. DT211]|uniref:GNAT family N-acetyltransferase n=1 Tax=Luteimicrobium sp. DT211 TaxID=3393412 RepID=UPI003CF89DC9
MSPVTSLEVRSVRLDDPLAGVLLDELFVEYRDRYADLLGVEELDAEQLARYVAEFRAEGLDEFLPPDGDLVLLLAGGVPVAGGAFRRRTEPEHGADEAPRVPTAELKRIWTHHDRRRQGLGRAVLAELERRAAERGYARVYLTTGPRQPEAVGLYLAASYTPLFDPDAVASAAPDALSPRPFEKWL